jgi:hypothetical protein
MRHAVFRRGAFQAHKVSISITEGEFQSLDLSGEFHCGRKKLTWKLLQLQQRPLWSCCLKTI